MAGHVRKRTWASGRVTWRARYPDPAVGGTDQIERVFRTRAEAEAWLADQTHSVATGTHLDPAGGPRRRRRGWSGGTLDEHERQAVRVADERLEEPPGPDGGLLLDRDASRREALAHGLQVAHLEEQADHPRGGLAR